MNAKYCLLVFFIGSMLTSSFAQSPRKIKEEAQAYFDKAKYVEALDYFSRYHRTKPQDLDAKLKIGICAYHVNRIAEAKRFLSYVIKNDKSPEAIAYLYLAKSFQEEFKFKEAVQYYKTYLKNIRQNSKYRKGVIDAIRRCAVGMRVKHQTELAIVENLGDRVNSIYDDFGPVFSPNYEDKLYFSSAREGTVGGLRDASGFVDEKYGRYSADMYTTNIVNGSWISSYPFNPLINSPRHDVVLGFNETGSVLYFSKGPSLYSGEAYVDTFRNTEAQDLFPPRYRSVMIFEEGDGTPYFFKDSILLFSSRREGGYGGSDLYVSELRNGVWTQAENLGPTINSAYDETTPFLAKDGRTLYFSSNDSRKSIGGFDVFKSKYEDRKKAWSTPENLGLPINSAGDDLGFKLAKDGLRAFYASSRKTGYGERDLYVAYFKSYQNEQKEYSSPLVFTDLNRVNSDNPDNGDGFNNSVASTSNEVVYSNEELITVEISPLYYKEDGDLFNKANLKILNKLASLMKEYPRMKVELMSNNDKAGPAKFDLYFSIKRAEKVADYLVNNGVRPSNILLKGAGANFPLAKNEVAGGPNEKGIAINRRIDIKFHNTQEYPLRLKYNLPRVEEIMVDKTGWTYQQIIQGLSYKVQLASIKQMYNSSLILEYPNGMVESSAASDFYKYTVGLYKSFVSVERLRRELRDKGVEDVFVVPYVNGIRISRIDANFYSEQYQDLKNYLNYTAQE